MTGMRPVKPEGVVLHTEWSAGYGGQEIRTLREMRALRERGWHFLLACRDNSAIADAADQQGFEVITLPFRQRHDLFTIRSLIRLVKQHSIDIVHTHSSIDAYCGGLAARLGGAAIVRSRHLSFQKLSRWKARLLYRYLADAVVCSSSADHELLASRASFSANTLITNRAGELPGDYPSLPLTEGFVLVLPGMLRRGKGHQEALEALAILRQEQRRIRLQLLGDGPQRPALQARIRELKLEDCVELVGLVDDVRPWLCQAHGILVPSHEEAFPQVVTQSLFSGTPLIASTVGDIPKVLGNGERGQLVEPKQAESLANAIRDLMDLPQEARERARKARLWAHQHLSFSQQTEKLEKLYRGLMSPR